MTQVCAALPGIKNELVEALKDVRNNESLKTLFEQAEALDCADQAAAEKDWAAALKKVISDWPGTRPPSWPKSGWKA